MHPPRSGHSGPSKGKGNFFWAANRICFVLRADFENGSVDFL